jgi:hypothetical protein
VDSSFQKTIVVIVLFSLCSGTAAAIGGPWGRFIVVVFGLNTIGLAILAATGAVIKAIKE